MAREWKARQAPAPPETITGAARRYHACALAFSQSLGIPLAEALERYAPSISAIYIETGRCDLRLPAGAKLPPLAPSHHGHAGDQGLGNAKSLAAMDQGEPRARPAHKEGSRPHCEASGPAGNEPRGNGEAPPTAIPADAGLPCGGQGIDRLKPAQLRMLLGKVESLAAAKGGRWAALLAALRAERADRLARGRRSVPSMPGEGERRGIPLAASFP